MGGNVYPQRQSKNLVISISYVVAAWSRGKNGKKLPEFALGISGAADLICIAGLKVLKGASNLT